MTHPPVVEGFNEFCEGSVEVSVGVKGKNIGTYFNGVLDSHTDEGSHRSGKFTYGVKEVLRRVDVH